MVDVQKSFYFFYLMKHEEVAKERQWLWVFNAMSGQY